MDPITAKGWSDVIANPYGIIVVLGLVITAMAVYIIRIKNEQISREKEVSLTLMSHADKLRESFEAIKGLVKRNGS